MSATPTLAAICDRLEQHAVDEALKRANAERFAWEMHQENEALKERVRALESIVAAYERDAEAAEHRRDEGDDAMGEVRAERVAEWRAGPR